MSFLFKSRKAPPPSALPQAARNLHTSDGTMSSVPSSLRDNHSDRPSQSPAPASGHSNSVGSMNSALATAPNGQVNRRERADSESGIRPPNITTQVPNAALYPWSQRRLTFANPQSNPFPRYGAAVNSIASKEGDIYMIGGLINGSMVRGDLWMVESGGGNLSCYSIATVSEGPGPRVGHASLLVGNAFIVFGGDTKMDDSDVLDDTLYLLNTSTRQWSRAAPLGPKPSGRYGHTLNILGSKIYIFGGQVEGYFFNDLIAFDLNALQDPANQWEFLIQNSGEGGLSNGPVPPARTNHTVISHNEQLILFGGTNGTQWFNDVWTYDPRVNSWSQQDCIGYIPAPREGHSAALVNDVMYIFGGRTEEGNDLGDLAAFRITSKRWYTFQNMGPSPSPRSGHSMTAHGKQVIVLGGEPSTSPRDASELSMVYVLDTAKIRYPNDSQSASQGIENKQPISPTRRPSTEIRGGMPGIRSVSREGQAPVGTAMVRNTSAAREPISGGPVQRPDNPPASRLPRSSVAQTPSGPPPQVQAPTPRTNGIISPPSGTKGRPAESKIPTLGESPAQAPAVKEVQKSEIPRSSSDGGSNAQGRRTPTQQVVSKAKAMEAGEAAPLVSSGVARQRSSRSQRGHNSVDSSEEGVAARPGSLRHHSDGHSSLKSLGDEPRSPRLNAHQEALVKELEATKRNNAWYASELAMARKAGYQVAPSSSPTFDERSINQFGDDDRPLVEAFMTMRTELLKMQQTLDQQTTSTAKRIAEVEHQRDAAVTEAAYARAKLAAHGGSQRSTPQPDGLRDHDDAERSTDISRRLAFALAAQTEHKNRLDSLNNDLSAERRAREAAEESADTAQRRLDELAQGRNAGEAEGLRAELHAAQSTARAEAGQRAEAEEQLRMLRIDHDSIKHEHGDLSSRVRNHTASLTALEAAVAASTAKVGLYERQLDEERTQREISERKLTQLKSEYEERVNELESTSKRLRDVEELADTHAKEAATHREALMTGFAKVSNPDDDSKREAIIEQRVAALRESAERASALAKQNQEAADIAAQKLRGAEERIAGLEAYQEQSNRESVQIRRQLQAALRDGHLHQNEMRELRGSLENHQRDANALSVQHDALKNLLNERGMSVSDARRSPIFDNSPSSRFGTPEQGRLRELELQLNSSLKAHDETKAHFESRMQEVDGTYKEKLEQLENDYQAAVHYVKGTEKMLKKMREELTKYKTQNSQLQTELESGRSNWSGTGATNDANSWASERENLQSSIDSIKSQMSGQITSMEANLASVQQELAAAKAERDQQRSEHEGLARSARQTTSELEQLRAENSMLQNRAEQAEGRVTILLDQVGNTVGNIRRQSQMASIPSAPNGVHHEREHSTSTITDTSSQDEDLLRDERGSIALDNLASELETLRTQWESTSRSNYRLSNQFDYEKTPTKENNSSELSDSLSNWRKRLDDEENGAHKESGLAQKASVI